MAISGHFDPRPIYFYDLLTNVATAKPGKITLFFLVYSMWTTYYIFMDLKDKITKSFNQKKVMTVAEICTEVGRAEITVKKALQEMDYFYKL